MLFCPCRHREGSILFQEHFWALCTPSVATTFDAFPQWTCGILLHIYKKSLYTNKEKVQTHTYHPPVFGITKRPPKWPKTPVVLSSVLVGSDDRFWMYGVLFLGCIVLKPRLFPWGKVPEWFLPWYSALSDTPRETMKELWTLTLMSERGLKSEDSVMSSLSSGSWRQMGPLYVRLTVRSGCIAGLRSREFPGKTRSICHSDTKRHPHSSFVVASVKMRICMGVECSDWQQLALLTQSHTSVWE